MGAPLAHVLSHRVVGESGLPIFLEQAFAYLRQNASADGLLRIRYLSSLLLNILNF